MKYLFSILKYAGLIRLLIFIWDRVMVFFNKVFYHFIIYKRSLHSSLFDLIKFSKRDEVELKKMDNDYLISFWENNNKTKAVLRDKTSDIAVFREIFILGEYQQIVEEINNSNIAIQSIIDVGANVGLAILFFHQHFPSATFVAVEPDQQNASQIITNCKLNNLDGLGLEQAGIWPYETRLNVTKNFRHGDSWSLSVEEDPANGNVKGVDFESIIVKYGLLHIDLLKIDIEGTEAILFKNPHQCKFLEQTKFICVETHLEVNSMSIVVNTLTRYDFDLSFNGDVIFGINRNLI